MTEPFKVLYPNMRIKESLGELHNEPGRKTKLDKVIKKVGKTSNLSKSTTMSIVTKLKTHGTIQTLLRSGCPTNLSNKARRAIVSDVTKRPATTLTEFIN